jgi:hypothetical protein
LGGIVSEYLEAFLLKKAGDAFIGNIHLMKRRTSGQILPPSTPM